MVRDEPESLSVNKGPGVCRDYEARRRTSGGDVRCPADLCNQHPDEDPETQQYDDHTPPEEGPFLLFIHDLLLVSSVE